MLLSSRRLVPAYGLAVLTLLPVVVYLHLETQYRAREGDAVDTLRVLTPDTGLFAAMDQVAKSLGARANTPMAGVDIIPAFHLPRKPPVPPIYERCGPFRQYGQQIAGFGCASFSLRSGSSVPEMNKVRSELLHRGASQLLRACYLRANGHEPSAAATALPAVLFVYLTVSVDGGEAFLMYPSTHMDYRFEFASRLWYGPPIRLGVFRLSPVYHDYLTNVPIVSIVRPIKAKAGATERVIADLRVSHSRSVVDSYLLNLFMALCAISIYWLYLIALRRRFLRYLILSTACIALEYLVLVVAHLGLTPVAGLSDSVLVSKVLAFLPTGALLVLSANSLPASTYRATGRTFARWWAVEIGAAGANVVVSVPIFGTAFSAFCLLWFSRALLRARRAHSGSRFEQMTPHPARLAVCGAIAYAIWSIAQFSVLFISFDQPIARAVTNAFGGGGGWAQEILSEAGPFLLLLYAKGLAFFLTVLYVASLDSARLMPALEPAEGEPYLELDPRGVITFQRHFSADPPVVGVECACLFSDLEDAQELQAAMRERVRLQHYLCRISTFGDRLMGLSLEACEPDVVGGGIVRLSPFDESALLRTLHVAVCREAAALSAQLVGTESPGAQLSLSVQHLAGACGLQAAMSARHCVLSATRMSTTQAYEVFAGGLERLEIRDPGFQYTEAFQDLSAFPRRLRAAPDILAIVVHAVLENIQDGTSLAGGSRRLNLSVERCVKHLDPRDEYLGFHILIEPAVHLDKRFARARAFENPSFRRVGDRWRPEDQLILATDLLKLFDGRFDLQSGEDATRVSVLVRFLVSSEGPV